VLFRSEINKMMENGRDNTLTSVNEDEVKTIISEGM